MIKIVNKKKYLDMIEENKNLENDFNSLAKRESEHLEFILKILELDIDTVKVGKKLKIPLNIFHKKRSNIPGIRGTIKESRIQVPALDICSSILIDKE